MNEESKSTESLIHEAYNARYETEQVRQRLQELQQKQAHAERALIRKLAMDGKFGALKLDWRYVNNMVITPSEQEARIVRAVKTSKPSY